MNFDNAGNTLITARTISPKATTQTFTDFLGANDPNDFYSFSVSRRSSFNLALNSLVTNADVQLIQDLNCNGIVDNANEIIASGNLLGTNSESIRTTLDAGNYFIRVLPGFAANTNGTSYNLSVSINTIPSQLQFNLNQDNLKNTDILSIYNGFVFDADGSSDLSVVDFRIKQSNGSFIQVSDAVSFTPYSYDSRWGSFNYELSLASLNLNPGSYTLAGVAYDKANNASQVVERQFTINGAPNSVAFTIDNINVSSTGTLNISRGQIFDPNGAFDITSIDLQIFQNGKLVNSVANDITRITTNPNDNRWGSFTHSLSLAGINLVAGSYTLRATAWDKAGNSSQSFEQRFNVIIPNTAPTWLSFAIDNPNVSNTGSLNLKNTQVFDANGASDISLIDLQIFQNGKLVNAVANDITRITANTGDTRWGSFNYSLSLAGLNLAAGSYSLRATAWDKAANFSQSFEQQFTIIAIQERDWFSVNLKDQQIIALTRDLSRDGNLSRNDMIAIFRNAKDGGVVDVNEISDFRTIITNAARFTMQDYVRVLSNKVTNSDIANTQSGIGNLFVGSSADQLERLLGKWFLGSDRPQLTSTQITYKEVKGSLFQNGISYQDVTQGSIGDCYFLAGLALTALRTPNVIESMFIDNGDNTFTVRFYNKGVADYVTVDRWLPTYVYSGDLAYAKVGGRFDNSNNELWVALAEKAYAQINESGWTLGPSQQIRTNSYKAIESGYGSAMNDITGRNTQYDTLDSFDMNAIVSAFNQGQMLYFGSKSESQVAGNVVYSHAYILVGYDSSTQKFRLYNPWGVNGGYLANDSRFKDGFLNLSFADLVKNFLGWYRTV